MLDISESVNFNYLIAPLLVLIVVMTIFSIIYSLIFFKILPEKVFIFFLVIVVLFGAYIWAVPMNMGFYEYFRATF